MKKKAVVLIILAFTILFFNQVLVSAQETKPGFITGTVKGLLLKNGRVFYTRIPHARVRLEFTNFETQTREDGKFLLSDIPPGEYEVEVLIAGEVPVNKTVIVKPVEINNAGVFTVYLAPPLELPTVKKGDIVASFLKEGNKKEQEGNKDSIEDRLLFYKPDKDYPYLEMVTDESPVWLASNSEGTRLLVSTLNQGILLYDLTELKQAGSYEFNARVAEIYSNPQKNQFFIPYYSPTRTGILKIDPQYSIPLKDYNPGIKGLIVAVAPIPEKNRLMAVLSLVKKGKIIGLDIESGALKQMENTGSLPMDLAYFPDMNELIVNNNLSKNIVFADADTLKTKKTINLESKPGKILLSKDQKYLFVTTPEKNRVVILYAPSKTIIKKLDVGNDPYQLKEFQNKIFVVNRKSGSFSIIDIQSLEVIRTSVPEQTGGIRGLEILGAD
ncbi:MAG: hypothetical protein ACLFQV_10700 [Vulcanimicrobiota bacterium]